MTATLQSTIRTDMVAAMKAREAVRLSVLRGLLTLCTQELTATKRTPQETLTDDEVLSLIRRSVKQRHDAAAQFTAGGRPELAEAELAEAELLATYLPQTMNREELLPIVQATIETMGIDKKNAGMIIGTIMRKLGNTADGSLVKELVTQALS